jgi:hypothetical protein
MILINYNLKYKIYNIKMSSKKKCVITNYIPHPTPSHTNFYKWYNEYENHLINLYFIFIDIIKNRHPRYDLDNEEYFNLFINHIFDSSSKFILKY